MTDSAQNAATRRTLLALGGATLGGAALAGGSAASAATGALDFADPKQRLRAYMLMHGALDDRLVVGCITGRYYGVVDNEVKPLYGLLGVTFARYRAAPGGGYNGASYEIPYFTDLNTGEVIDQYLNPYTGQTVAVAHGGFPPARTVISADLKTSVPKPIPGLTIDNTVLPADVIGDDVWITEETFSALQIPGRLKPVRYSELVTMHAKTPDLADPSAKRVPCQTSYTSIVSWRPWLKMGDHPGHLIGYGVGRYGVTMEDLPASWRRAVQARLPESLKNPGAPLAALLG
jgi:hypothetical protein